MVIAVESGWLDRIGGTQLYRYLLPGEAFALIDATAGHYVSRAPVEPIAVEPVGDLLAALVDAGVELRVMPRLGPLWQAVVASTLEFSGTRLRNACDWPAGFGALGRK